MKNLEDMERRLVQSGKADKVRKLDANQVERAVQSGDSDALSRILMDVLRTSEGRRIAQQLEQTMKE